MPKMTPAQIALLNRAERNSTFPGVVTSYGNQPSTLQILRDLGYLEQGPLYSAQEKAEIHSKISQTTHLALSHLGQHDYRRTGRLLWEAMTGVGRLEATCDRITEAGRQALIAANGGH